MTINELRVILDRYLGTLDVQFEWFDSCSYYEIYEDIETVELMEIEGKTIVVLRKE